MAIMYEHQPEKPMSLCSQHIHAQPHPPLQCCLLSSRHCQFKCLNVLVRTVHQFHMSPQAAFQACWQLQEQEAPILNDRIGADIIPQTFSAKCQCRYHSRCSVSHQQQNRTESVWPCRCLPNGLAGRCGRTHRHTKGHQLCVDVGGHIWGDYRGHSRPGLCLPGGSQAGRSVCSCQRVCKAHPHLVVSSA